MDIKNLRKIPFFSKFTDDQLNAMQPYLNEVHLDKNEFLFKDGDAGKTFFVIVSGEVEILSQETHLATLRKGEFFGEMAFLGKCARTTSARAKKNATLIEISLEALLKHNHTKEIGGQMISQFPEVLTERVKQGNITTIKAVKKQLEHEKARSHLGNCLVYLIVLIFFYIYSIKLISVLNITITSSTAISVPILIIFAVFMIHLIKKTDYPLSEYGFNLKNWKKNLGISLLLTFPILLMMLLIKWIVIHTLPGFSHLHLISISPSLSENVPYTPALFAILVLAYLVFVPVQEMIYRGAMQTTLEKLLLSKNKTLVAILISNLPFSMIHLHLSFLLTLSVYFFGVFWGYLFAKQRSLLGCTVSHLILGFWGFFVIGMQDVLRV